MRGRMVLDPTAEKVMARFQSAVANYDRTVDKAASEAANEAVRLIRKRITSGSLGLAPLSPKWAARKAKKGLDPRILIATKRYLNSIKAVRSAKATYVIVAGSVGALLEEKSPPRPHLSVILNSIKPALREKAGRVMMKSLFGR